MNIVGFLALAALVLSFALPMYCKIKIMQIDREINRLEGVSRSWWKKIFTMNER